MERSGAARLTLPRLALPGVSASAPAWLKRRRHALALARGRITRHSRLALLFTALSLLALAGGWLWLRGSSLVGIERVRIEGVQGPQSTSIERALQEAARSMTTLDFNAGALRAAVRTFPVVASITAATRFPHGLAIIVRERPAVAMLEHGGGWRSAAAANGVALGPGALRSGLPRIETAHQISTGNSAPGASTRELLAVIGAAPPRLAAHVRRLYVAHEGLAVQMRSGLKVYFGRAERARAKWLALALVLSDAGSAGASYVDVRVPERPAAGFASGAGPSVEASAGSGEGSSSAQELGSSETTITALAEELKLEAGGTPSSTATTTPSPPVAAAGSEAGTQGEASTGASEEPAIAPTTSVPTTTEAG